MASIAIVDDNPVALASMGRMLESAGLGTVRTYREPRAALRVLADDPPDVLLVDYSMPELDGAGFLERLREHAGTRHVAAAVVTDSASIAEVRARALGAGAVDVIPKLLARTELVLKVGNLMRLVGRPVGGRTEGGFHPLVARRVGAPPPVPVPSDHAGWMRVLEQVAALGDEDCTAHTRRVGRYAAAIARAHGLREAECRLLEQAAPLHDIGNLALSVDVRTGERVLTPEERAERRQHTVFGHTLLSAVDAPVMRLAAEIALGHHERWDGAGYPNRLAGEQIPLSARMVAVADTFDLLTSIRPFRAEWLLDKARAVIGADAGGQFDPAVVASFDAAQGPLAALKASFDGAEAAAPPRSRFDLLRRWH